MDRKRSSYRRPSGGAGANNNSSTGRRSATARSRGENRYSRSRYGLADSDASSARGRRAASSDDRFSGSSHGSNSTRSAARNNGRASGSSRDGFGSSSRDGRNARSSRDGYDSDSNSRATSQNAAGRLSRGEYAKTHKAKRHGKLFYCLIAAVAVLVIGAGAAFAYVHVLSGNLQSGLGDVNKYLVKTNMTKEPFYMLLMGTDGSSERDESGDFGDSYRTDSIMLARIDPVNKKVTLVSLHRDTMIDYGSEYGVGKLNAAHVYGGPSLSVQTVSNLAGVDISHYAEINFDGFREIVDALGGIEVDVPMTIDDEDAGGHLDAGQQTLNGDQALILCRARHAYDEIGPGDEYRAANQRLVMAAIAKKLLSADVATMASTVQALSNYVTTDLGVSDIIGLAQAMQGLDPSTDISSAMEPTTSQYIDGVWYEVNNASEWKAMMKRVDAGLSPTEGNVVDQTSGTILASAGDGSSTSAGEAGSSSTVKSGGSVAIRNGNGVSGAGLDAAERITGLGYSVNTSNADNFNYKKTLVVYKTAADKEYAEAIASNLGVGEVMQNDNTYLFEEDFLVVLGADWK